MKIITKLRERKDHFVITIYRPDREKMNFSVGDILLLKIGDREIMRPIRKGFVVSLPKKIRKRNGLVRIRILNICKEQDTSYRPDSAERNGMLDIRYFMPQKTEFGYSLCLIKRNENSSYLYYCIPGGAAHMQFKNYVKPECIAELIGFYFGDGSTSKGISSFRLTNSEPSILNHCLKILKMIGISKNIFRIQIVYSTDKQITPHITKRCINYWARTLRTKKEQFVSVTKATNKRETLRYGSARLCVDKKVFVELFLHGLLRKIVSRIISPHGSLDLKLLRGFIRGLLAAEGCPMLNEYGSLVRVGIAYDPHSNEAVLYTQMLMQLGIKDVHIRKGHNELCISDFANLKKIYDMDGFKLHDKRNKVFIKGMHNHKKFNHGE